MTVRSQDDVRLVFVSHAGEDTWVARQIAREIASRGARPFLDEADVDVGAEFEEDIRLFLDESDEIIVLLLLGHWTDRMFGPKLGPPGFAEYR